MSSPHTSRPCPHCGQLLVPGAIVCPNCSANLGPGNQATTQPPPYAPPYGTIQGPYPTPIAYPKSKVAAALFAFFLGAFGAHGFYIGNNTMGLVLLLTTVVSIPLMCVLVGYVTYAVVGIVSLVQFILYLCATDEEFHQKYVVEKRWF